MDMSTLRADACLARFDARGRDCLPGYLGIEMTSIAQGTGASRMVVKTLHFAPNSYLHAASVIALADSTCGFCTEAHLPEGAVSFTTVELKSNHVSTVRSGVATCVATAVHLGKSTQVWDATVKDEASGRTLALYRCTQMILWPKS
jgi:1,4-dihydroxy-2-naphthoyl-CoA hydrolase